MLCRLFCSCGDQGLLASCGAWAPWLWLLGCGAQAQKLCRVGLVAPQQVGSSQIRDRTGVSCTGRRVLYHGATRKAHLVVFSYLFVFGCVRSLPQRAGSYTQPAGTQTLVAVHRLGCPLAWGVLVPRPGMEPKSPAL